MNCKTPARRFPRKSFPPECWNGRQQGLKSSCEHEGNSPFDYNPDATTAPADATASWRSMYSKTRRTSHVSASYLMRFARIEMTRTFPLTYPSSGIILSKLGELSLMYPAPVFGKSGMPSTGQNAGIAQSASVMLNGRPSGFARDFALCIIDHSGRFLE